MEVDESPPGPGRKPRVRKEPATTTTSTRNGHHRTDSQCLKEEHEPEDFIETHCNWVDCGIEFLSQNELVQVNDMILAWVTNPYKCLKIFPFFQHIAADHIHGNKKSFICRWRDCSREEKPFKALYMLVVHMRRHTGEKPYNCTVSMLVTIYTKWRFYAMRKLSSMKDLWFDPCFRFGLSNGNLSSVTSDCKWKNAPSNNWGSNEPNPFNVFRVLWIQLENEDVGIFSHFVTVISLLPTIGKFTTQI